jgi:hypothetical protein
MKNMAILWRKTWTDFRGKQGQTLEKNMARLWRKNMAILWRKTWPYFGGKNKVRLWRKTWSYFGGKNQAILWKKHEVNSKFRIQKT